MEEPKLLIDLKKMPPDPKDILYLIVSWPFQLILAPLYGKVMKAIDAASRGASPF
jgi:hypothetical protein